MANIAVQDARGLYTKSLIAVYAQRRKPSSFFTSLYKKVISDTLELSIEVQRGQQLIAVDVARGTEGNRNTFNYSTEKVFIPPYFKEFFNITDIDLYDRLYLGADVSPEVVARFIRTAAQKMDILKDKIDRAVEKMCADALLTGIITTKNGDNINFGRKAASLLDGGSTTYFTDGSLDVFSQFEADAQFIRDNGLVTDVVFNVILGSQALHDLLNNTSYQNRQKLFQQKLDNVMPPEFNELTGFNYHGQITIGKYRANLLTVVDTYKDRDSGTITPFMDTKKYIMVPMNTDYVLGYGANPQLITDPAPGIGIVKGEYIMYDFVDPQLLSHTFNIQSSPLPIPVAIDTAVTRKVVA